MKAICYNTKSGCITKAIEGSLDIIKLNLGKDESYIEGDLENKALDDYLVSGKSLVIKPTMNVSIVNNKIRGIPVNTTVCVNSQGFQVVNDGELELVGTYPDNVLVTLFNEAYQSLTLTVAV